MRIAFRNSTIFRFQALSLITLAILQLALILGSWIWSAAMPESPVRAILSDSGIRWFFGTFVTNLSSPLLIYIILLDFALGTAYYSGTLSAFLSTINTIISPILSLFHHKGSNSRTTLPPSKVARGGSLGGLFCLLFEILIVLLLILPRHAILLSATGRLFPSSFSVSLIPIIAFMIFSSSIVSGLFSGALHGYRDVIHCCIRGGGNLKFILAFYVMAMELFKMIIYVEG